MAEDEGVGAHVSEVEDAERGLGAIGRVLAPGEALVSQRDVLRSPALLPALRRCSKAPILAGKVRDLDERLQSGCLTNFSI